MRKGGKGFRFSEAGMSLTGLRREVKHTLGALDEAINGQKLG